MSRLKQLGGIVVAALVFGCSDAGTVDSAENTIELTSKLSRYLATGFKDAQRSWITGESLADLKQKRSSRNARQVSNDNTEANPDLIPFGEKADELLKHTPGNVQRGQNNGDQQAVTKEVTKAFFRAIFLKAIVEQKGEDLPEDITNGALFEERANALWHAYEALRTDGVANPLDTFDPLVKELADFMGEIDITSVDTSGERSSNEEENAKIAKLFKAMMTAVTQITKNLRKSDGSSYLNLGGKKVGSMAEKLLRIMASAGSSPELTEIQATLQEYGNASGRDREAKLDEVVGKFTAMLRSALRQEGTSREAEQALELVLRLLPVIIDPVSEQILLDVAHSIQQENMQRVFDELKATMEEFSRNEGEEYRKFDMNNDTDEVKKALDQIGRFIGGLPSKEDMMAANSEGPDADDQDHGDQA